MERGSYIMDGIIVLRPFRDRIKERTPPQMNPIFNPSAELMMDESLPTE